MRLDEINGDLASDLENWRSENQESMPFDNIFGSPEVNRIVVPMHSDPIAGGILDKIKTAGLNIDYQQGVVYDPKHMSGTEFARKYHRSQRIGKWVLGRNSGCTPQEQKWWNHQAEAIDALKKTEEEDEYAIVLSRHPIDVVRMSDHDGWSSCHSTDGSYFKCAVTDAKGGGLIAYVVNKSDLKDIKKEDWNDGEIFKDKERKTWGIEPLSRLRLRMFTHKKKGYDLAVPEVRTYGEEIPGFEDSIAKFALEKQKPTMEKHGDTRPSTADFKRMGGSYQDNRADKLFNRFFGDSLDNKDAEYGAKDDYESIADQHERELEEIEEEFREEKKKWKFATADAEMDQADDQPYIWVRGYAHIEIDDDLFTTNLPSWGGSHVDWEERRKITDAMKEVFNDAEIYGIEEVDWDEHGNTTTIRCSFHNENGNNHPDDYREMLVDIRDNIEPKAAQAKRDMYAVLMSLGYMDNHPVNDMRNNWARNRDKPETTQFQNFSFDYDHKEEGNLVIDLSRNHKLTPVPLGQINIPQNHVLQTHWRRGTAWPDKEVAPEYLELLQNWRKLFSQRMIQLYTRTTKADQQQKWIWPELKPTPATQAGVEPEIEFNIDKDGYVFFTIAFNFDVTQDAADVEDAVQFIQYLDQNINAFYQEAQNLFKTITHDKMMSLYKQQQDSSSEEYKWKQAEIQKYNKFWGDQDEKQV